jgi:hypothetical protein
MTPDRLRALAWVTCGAAVVLLVSPLKLLWARSSLGWMTPFVLWGILIVLGGYLARGSR